MDIKSGHAIVRKIEYKKKVLIILILVYKIQEKNEYIYMCSTECILLPIII